MRNNIVTGRGYDYLVGKDGVHIVAGETALLRVGLTTLLCDHIQAWTPYADISGLESPVVSWYFSPFYNQYFDTKPSIACPNILEPTRERALIEYILFKDYFNEGILIEGLKSYMWLNDGNVQPLYDEAPKFSVPKEAVDYWLKEAREDYDD